MPEDDEPGFGEDFDADIAAIFGEEATELLEQSEAAFGRWRADRADHAQVIELKRLLHTLKGGARMAGIRAMGDLSHEVESFLAAIESGTSTADAAAFDVLQSSLDELHRMREMANSGQRLPSARNSSCRSGRWQRCQRLLHPWSRCRRPRRSRRLPSPSKPQSRRPRSSNTSQSNPTRQPSCRSRKSCSRRRRSRRLPAAIVIEAPAEPSVVAEAVEPSAAAPVAAAEIEQPMAEPTAAVERGQPAERPSELPAVAAAVAAPVAPARFVVPTPSQLPATYEVAATAHTPVLPGREPVAPTERGELARVDADLLDDLLNNAGEVSIFRARIEQQMTSIEFNLAELDRTVTRLREQLRKLEMETEAQILNKHQTDDQAQRTDFDPLELDRYSNIQQLSRALAESVSDVASIEGLLAQLNRDTQNLLQQQGRVVTEVQNGLMRTRMVPFQRHVHRLTRLLRQAATEAGKKAELIVEGASGELDRQVLERMLPPFEHMLRNAVVHGLETPAERVAAGKPETGQITLKLQREGAEVVITVEDDGAGLNVAAIHAKARQMGLLQPGMELTDEESLQLILEPGFSTADRLTQQAGRGVGMDVVATEIKKLGGALFIESKRGAGARFTSPLAVHARDHAGADRAGP